MLHEDRYALVVQRRSSPGCAVLPGDGALSDLSAAPGATGALALGEVSTDGQAAATGDALPCGAWWWYGAHGAIKGQGEWIFMAR